MKTLFDTEVPPLPNATAQTQMKSQDMPIWVLYQNREKYENYEAFQRKKVWPRIMSQSLVNTILFGGIVPPIITLRKISSQSGTLHYVIDGQQRLAAIFGFLDEHFRTVRSSLWHHHEPGIEPIEPGKYFRELSPKAQELFKEFTLTIYSSEDMNMSTASFLFRQLNKHVPLVRAERLNSYQSEFLRYAHELASHPFWQEIYKGKRGRAQVLRGCLYALTMQIKQTTTSMAANPIAGNASGRLDKELSPDIIAGCQAKFGQIMHVFAKCCICQAYEFIPMYQSIQLLEKEGYTFDFVSSGIFTRWYQELQREAIHMRYNRTGSIFLQMENIGYQDMFWQKHLPTLCALLNK